MAQRSKRPGSKMAVPDPKRQQSAKRERRVPYKRIFGISGLTVLGVLVCGVGATVGYAAAMLKGLPPISPAQFVQHNQPSVVYDRTGKVVGRFSADGDREPIASLDQVSPYLVNAFVAAEDKTFFHNIGINPLSMGRAFVQDLLFHSIQSGASTITQQTVKLALFPEQQRTMHRKIQEIALALQLNKMLSKDEIMTDYMNWVYMGRMGTQNVYGVKAASEVMFHKDPRSLNLPEAAFLASIPNNASLFSPYQFFNNTTARQHYVLQQMYDNKMITYGQYQSALKYNIKKDLRQPSSNAIRYPYIMIDNIEPLVAKDLVASGAYDTVQQAEAALPTAGYQIYTSLDLTMQNDVSNVLSNDTLFTGTNLPVPGQPNQSDLYEAGVTLIDNQTGGILAIGGGRHFNQDEYDHSDLARQPGSSIKPLIDYGPAIDTQKYTAGTIIMDEPLKLAGYKTPPQNDDNMFHGMVTVRAALTASFNIPAMKVLQSITPEFGTSYLPKMGITTHSTTIDGQPTLVQSDTQQVGTAIGGLSNGLTVQQMTSAYTVFPNQGVWRQSYLISRIVDKSGNPVYQFQPQVNRVFSPQTAYIMTSMLHDVVYNNAPYPFTGTAVAIGKNFPGDYISGKTGTTDSQRDGWFVGYTQQYTMGIWMGYNHHQAIPSSAYGLKFQIWSDIMSPILAKDPAKTPWPKPPGVVTVAICKKSGQLPTPLCYDDKDVYKELFIQGTQPTSTCTVHVQVKYTVINGKKYLATTNTPPSEVQTGIFLNPPNRPAVRTYDSWEYVPTQPDPRGGTVLVNPNSEQAVSGLTAPANLTAQATTNGIQVSWDAVQGATGYMVWRSTDANGPFINIAGPMTDTSYLDSTLPSGVGTVYYEIYAISNAGMSGPSAPTAVQVPAALQNMSQNNSTSNALTVTAGAYGSDNNAANTAGGTATGANTGGGTSNTTSNATGSDATGTNNTTSNTAGH